MGEIAMLYTITICDPDASSGDVWATNDVSFMGYWNGLSWTRNPAYIGLFTSIQAGAYIQRVNAIERALVRSGRCQHVSTFKIKRVR
jgi:hypothetical protein